MRPQTGTYCYFSSAKKIAAMNNTLRKALCFVLPLLVLCAIPGHSQFLKDVLNHVKQTAQNRANDKASQNTNKSLDKVDSTFTGKGGSGGSVAGSTTDSSGSAAVMKGLGNFMGRGGVSAADSAKALAAYKNANGGSGTYYEYTIETTSKRGGASKSTAKMYFTGDGEGRSEMNLAAMMGAKNAAPMITIGRASQLEYSVSLDDSVRKYSLNVIDTALINSGFSTYKITKLGEENINGYSCIHAKLQTTTGSGLFKSTSTMQLWTSTGVTGYSSLKKMMLQNVTPAMMKALEAAGCGGFIVKMASDGNKNYSMTMLLTKAEGQTFSAALFKIPAGYTQSNDNLMLANMMGAASKQ
jgi:hypothetical protein